MATTTGLLAPATRRLSGEALLLAAALTLVWGLNWPVMKLALAELGVLQFRSLALLQGAVGLPLLVALRGQRLLPPRRLWGRLILAGLCTVGAWHLLSGFALLHIAGGRASIIGLTMPLWATILALLFLHEQITRRLALGLGLGMTGLLTLLWPEMHRVGAAPLGALLMLAAAMTWATGTVLNKAIDWAPMPPLAVVAWQVTLSTLPALTGYLLIGEHVPLDAISLRAWACTLFTGLVTVVFAYWAYFRLIRIASTALATISILGVPVVGVTSSAVLLGEPITAFDLVAMLCLVAGLSLALLPRRAG